VAGRTTTLSTQRGSDCVASTRTKIASSLVASASSSAKGWKLLLTRSWSTNGSKLDAARAGRAMVACASPRTSRYQVVGAQNSSLTITPPLPDFAPTS
jgi:hypothetical protein